MSKKWGYMYHVGWVFGILVVLDGLLNLFWGNDFGFGVFILLLSSIYFPPVNMLLRNRFCISIPCFVKIGIGLFLIWATLAVGALAEGYILCPRNCHSFLYPNPLLSDKNGIIVISSLRD